MSDNKSKSKIFKIKEETDKHEEEEEKVDDPGSDEENEVQTLQIKIESQGELVADGQNLITENKELKNNRKELKKS